MDKKAALVIGVNKTGGLEELKSAAKGAQDVTEWLRGQGFTVECITDIDEPVTTERVKKSAKKLVTDPARYHMLVVYFSGHGMWQTTADIWLLSNAPNEPDEAINLLSSIDLLKYSGIKNIVFISDACRSMPDTYAGTRIKGRDVFLNRQGVHTPSDIDVFRAVTETNSAYEGEIDGEPHSVLTYALMSAFEEPTQDIIRDIKVGKNIVKVVPNRQLRKYLQPKVNELLGIIAKQNQSDGTVLKQVIEVTVPSDDDVYISKILGTPPAAIMLSGGGGGGEHSMMAPMELSRATGFGTDLFSDTVPEIETVGQDAAEAIQRELVAAKSMGNSIDTLSVVIPETENELAARLPVGDVDHFETQTGFVVHGVRVVEVESVSQDNSHAELVNPGNGSDVPAVIRAYPSSPAFSVVIRLENGRSAVFAALFGYIGHAYFERDGLANVTYTPSTNNERWQWYEHRQDKVNRLRALISVAVQHNAFNIESERDAEALADRIRVEKNIDPTLGLYAAHAYYMASKDFQIGSVMRYMNEDLHADLFDVQLLASRIANKPDTSGLIVPFCPMLTRTWNLLGPRGVKLPPVLQEAENYLCDSLWTTFEPEATDKIFQAIKSGEIA